MTRKQHLLWLLPLLLAVSVPFWRPWLAAFLQPRGDTLVEPLGDRQRTFVMEDIRYQQSRSGLHEWHFSADRLASSNNENQLLVVGIKALINGNSANDVKQVDIESRQGEFDQNGQVLTLIGDVAVTFDNQYRMTTQLLRYLVAHRTIKASEGVRLAGTGFKARGWEAFYDLDSGDYRMVGRVSCRVW